MGRPIFKAATISVSLLCSSCVVAGLSFLFVLAASHHLDQIRIALSEPVKLDQVLAEKMDPKTKPLTSDQLKVVKQQVDVLQPEDVLILNEVYYGVTRTGYRDVTRDLVKALNMNYAYG